MIAWWQIALLTLYAGYQILDELQIYSAMSSPVFAGLISGLVMGDMKAGLLIGASTQLMVLGVGTFGGASKIDANSGTILATAFSVSAGMKPEAAVAAIAVPVASIMIQTDILARFSNTFFAHRIDKMVDQNNYKGIERYFLAGASVGTVTDDSSWLGFSIWRRLRYRPCPCFEYQLEMVRRWLGNSWCRLACCRVCHSVALPAT